MEIVLLIAMAVVVVFIISRIVSAIVVQDAAGFGILIIVALNGVILLALWVASQAVSENKETPALRNIPAKAATAPVKD